MIIQEKVYDGSLIHKRFAYRYYRNEVLASGNIVAFRAPMKVETEGMIDQEDLFENDFIYSEDAINFCWEIPNLCPFGATSFQRLFNTGISNILRNIIEKDIEVDGDDIIVHAAHNQGGVHQSKGKCSVSITISKDNVALGHTGINIVAGKQAPAFAYSTHLNDNEANQFMTDVINYFYNLTDDIFISTTKVF